MQVGDIMHTDVKAARPDDTFADVAKLMRLHGISSVVVLDGNKLAGIVTERDIVNLVDLETVSPKTDVAEAAEHMVSRNIRHLPVTDTRGRVVGIISIRDLTRWASEELSGGHEMPDIERSHKALKAASELSKQRRRGTT
jgi:CBS domain-containing protein